MIIAPTSQYAENWRYPPARPDWLDARFYADLARTLERGCFDMMFMADALGSPRTGRAVTPQPCAPAARAPSTSTRPSSLRSPRPPPPPPPRSRRDGVHDASSAVSDRPDVAQPRSPLRRPGRVEHGHVDDRRGGPQHGPARDARQDQAIRPRRPSRAHGARPVAHLGAGRPRPRPLQSGLRRPLPDRPNPHPRIGPGTEWSES